MFFAISRDPNSSFPLYHLSSLKKDHTLVATDLSLEDESPARKIFNAFFLLKA